MAIATGRPAATLELPEERQQGSRVSAAVGVEDLAGLEVEHDGHVALALLEGELVHGEVAHLRDLAPDQLAAQVLLVDLLDQVPADTEQLGRRPDRGDPAQLDHVAAEGLQVPPLALGEVDRLA